MDHNQNPNQNPLFQFIRSTFRQGTADGEDENAQSSGGHSETFVSQNASAAHSQTQAGIQMNAEYDDIPPLQDVSDSGESNAESESDRDANEVEMQAVDQNNADADASTTNSGPRSFVVYRSFAPPPVRQNSNRRPRVDDDDDEERDRRHPSQRVSSANNHAASSSSPAQTSSSASLPHIQPHTHTSIPISGASDTPHPPTRQPSNVQRHVFHTTINLGPGGPGNPFRLFQHLFPNNNVNEPNPNPTNNANTDNSNLNAGGSDNNTPPGPPPLQPPQPPNGNNGPRAPPTIFGGMVSFDLGPGGVLLGVPAGGAMNGFPGGNPAANTQQAQGLPPHLAELLSRIGATFLGGFGMDNQEDPDRARKLVDGLEVVPEGLVRRLERVGGSGGGMGEDPTSGGDSGCAICWDRLLDSDGEGFGPSEAADPKEGSSLTEARQRKIVSLPCAHVFHAECLIPWFSRPRQTTCPTCRFNIDPDNLTYVSWSGRQRERQDTEAAATRTAEGTQPATADNVDAAAAPNLNVPSTADAPPAPGAIPNATNDARSAREQLVRELAALYADTNPGLAALFGGGNAPVNQQTNQQEPQGAQAGQQQQQPQPPQHPHHQHGPAVTVTSIPIPIPFPVAVPLGGLHPGANPSTNTSTTFAPSGNAPTSTPNIDASSGTNPSTTAAAPTSPGVNAPRTPADGANRMRFNPGWPLGLGLGLGSFGAPNGNPNTNPLTAAPGARPPQANTFNLEGLDFGIPGMRADVVVTMDMIFDPIGLGGPHRHDNHNPAEAHGDAADHHHHHPADEAGQMQMEEDVMMLMPEDENAAQEAEQFQRMLEMFAGPGRNPVPGNANRNPQEQPQPPPGLGNEAHVAEADRNMAEAFARLLAGMSGGPPRGPQGQAGEQDAQARPEERGAPTQPQPQGDAQAPAPGPQHQPRIWRGGFNMPPTFGQFPDIFGPGGPGARRTRSDAPKPAWTLPPAPGPTLRQRVERREREAGLRCYDISCGLGPSDEDPFTDEMSQTVSRMKQLTIRQKDADDAQVCEHRFHNACLVSAERVALSGADAVVEDGHVDVSCPVCRSMGCVTKEEWNEGVAALG